jgi:hypothetical protein
VTRIRDFIKNEVRGKRNFHKIMVLEAESQNPMGISNGRVTVEIKPLQHFIHDDGQFMKYMERNDDKIGSVFRNPRIARANTQDFNRATADAAMRTADNQVYAPLREEFDWFMNHVLLEALGVRFFTFRTLAPKNTDKEELSMMIDRAASRGYLSLPELRRLAADLFQVEFQEPDTNENLDVPVELLRLRARSSATEATETDAENSQDAKDQSEGGIPPSKRSREGATPESQEMMDTSKSLSTEQQASELISLLSAVGALTKKQLRFLANERHTQSVSRGTDDEL